MAAMMSLKQEIETWVAALARYDNNEFDDALAEFEKITDTSKILFNMGVIHATLGEHEKAVECYQRAIRLDQYLAVAYFQQGVSNFLIGDFEEALANFNDALLYLRGNSMIDYSQLGLLFKLYSCEVLFNRGLCYIYLQQKENGMQDLMFAVKEKVVDDHNVIDEAIQEEAQGYTVFSIPIGVVYRPNEAKVRNLKTKDYLGKAKLVATSDPANAFTGFAGSEQASAARIEVQDDRPVDNISFAASNLVRPGLASRRQQSEPPVNRNLFPPTPPPEGERPGRSSSVRTLQKPSPAKLSIQPQEPNRKYEKAFSPPDAGPRHGRSASATPVRGMQGGDWAPAPLQRRPTAPIVEEVDPSNLYDMYRGGLGSQPSTYMGQGPRRSQGSRRRGESRQRTNMLDQEPEESDFDGASFDEGDFEMLSSTQRGLGSGTSGPSRTGSRRPEVRKIRIKVHAQEVRYVMVTPNIEFSELEDRLRDKLALKRRFKIKVKDEDMPDGEMITMGDQDDLDMLISNAKSEARRDMQEVAKMNIWIFES